MPTSLGRSVGRGGIGSRANILVADGEGGSKAGSAGAEDPFEADPFLEAAASALSSDKATAAFRKSWLWRAATWASALECRQIDDASEVPWPMTSASSTNRVKRDLTSA